MATGFDDLFDLFFSADTHFRVSGVYIVPTTK
jgi:hypothetical protein